MRSPEHRYPYTRADKTYEEQLRYKTPDAFTVLPPENEAPPEPSTAPQPYRLTPSSRRHRNLAFAILPEPTSRPGSRSPSPSGRVSPFKGRGFNPIGSRHVSPAPSPPPEEKYATYNNNEFRSNSKIPKLTRRGSATVFGEQVNDYQSSPTRRKLNSQLSQSLTNLANSRQRLPAATRPPPSPRRPSTLKNQRLSPIVGSSPEPSQSQSSPKYANPRSQPSSRYSSPIRSHSFVHNKNGKPPPRGASRPASRNISRDPSPSQNPTSPTRIPIKKYNNVQAKVNSYHKPKPKVPPKPSVLTDETTEDSDKNTVLTKNNNNNRRRVLDRKESIKNRTNSSSSNNNKINVLSRTPSNRNIVNKTNNNNNSSNNNANSKNNVNNKTTVNKSNSKVVKNESKPKIDSKVNVESPKKQVKPSDDETPVKLSDLLQPSATTVVSSTTTTVTQPLKIEAKIEPPSDKSSSSPAKRTVTASSTHTISPIVDGRVLSATSVSSAMNKMNDTVLDTQTLMKEHGLPKLSPAASTIIAMSNDGGMANKHRALDTKNATTALPSVEADKKPETNHVSSTGIIPARVLDQHVSNNMTSLMNPEVVQKSVNDRIKEARTVVANDVKPIKITVKEKPMDVEVQSGNIRFDTSNGLNNERPGLPPSSNQGSNNEAPADTQDPPKTNCCTRFMSSCKKKLICCGSSETKQAKKINEGEDDETNTKSGCFNCRKKKPDVTINIESEEPKRTSCWDQIKCCGKNRVGDTTTGCFPSGKRKNSWTERRDSILSDLPPAKKGICSCCSGFFRKMFCLDRCRKKPKKVIETEASRRASMISKKKSLTPSSVPQEETKPKIDMSLVEHTSQMKGAIPVLPLYLAWFCLVMNCIAPGTGTVFSGMFCLCIGKPRFSQNDGPRPRIGSFIINLIIGFGQFFTVLFCLVGWGWSIWWGLIMLKLAKKNRKIKAIEAAEEAQQQRSEGARPVGQQNHRANRDPERGS